MHFRGYFYFAIIEKLLNFANDSFKRMPYNNTVISKSRLLSYFEDMNNDCFRISQVEPEVRNSASPSFHDSTLISAENLSDAQKKCANYLEMFKIRVNTHTHTHTHTSPRALLYKLFLKNQSVIEIFSQGISLVFSKLSEPLYATLTDRGCVSSYPSAVYAGACSSSHARIRRRCAFSLTRQYKFNSI